MSDPVSIVVKVEEVTGVECPDPHAIAEGLSDRLGTLLAADSCPTEGAVAHAAEVSMGSRRAPSAPKNLGARIADVVHEQIAIRRD